MARKRKGPVVNNGIYRQMHNDINRTGRRMKTVREQGYGGLDSAIRGIYKNTLSTQTGFRKDLDRHNSRVLRKVLEHTSNSRAANRRLTHATEKRLDAFGGGPMLAEGNAQAVNTLRRQAKNDARVGNVASRGVGVVADASNRALEVIEAGTREAGANASALAAESFSQRTNEDLALISQQHHDVAMQKLQFQQQMAQMEKQAELDLESAIKMQKLAEKELGPEKMGLLRPQLAAAEQLVPQIMKQLEEGMDPQTIITNLAANNDPEDLDVIRGLVHQLATDTQKGADVDQLAAEVLAVFQDLPAWQGLTKAQKARMKTIMAKRFSVSMTNAVKEASQEDEGPVDDRSPIEKIGDWFSGGAASNPLS